MGFLTEKILLGLFIARLKTKRITKSMIRGKINYNVRKSIPFLIGTMVIGWAIYLYLI